MRKSLVRRLAALTLLCAAACTRGGGAPPPAAVPQPPPPLPTITAAPPALPTPAPSPAPRELVTLEGTVTYLQRVALTPEAVVQVELRDMTLSDTGGLPIAKKVIQRPGQVPVAFSLAFEPGPLVASHRYALSARISDRGQLQFVTENPVAVVPRAGQAPVEIVVVPVR